MKEVEGLGGGQATVLEREEEKSLALVALRSDQAEEEDAICMVMITHSKKRWAK